MLDDPPSQVKRIGRFLTAPLRWGIAAVGGLARRGRALLGLPLRLLHRLGGALLGLPLRLLRRLGRALRDLVLRPWRWAGDRLAALVAGQRRLRRRIAEGVRRHRQRLSQPILLRPTTALLLLLLALTNLGLLGIQVAGLSQARSAPTATPTATSAGQVTLPPATPVLSPADADRLAALALTPTPTPFGGGGAIAFSLRREGNADIYAVNLGDRKPVRLTYHPAEDVDPAWSPDGQTLAFASRRGNNWDIYRMDLQSLALIRLTRSPDYEAHPTWSPDGKFIAYEAYRDGNLDIYIMTEFGEEPIRLTYDPAPDFAPAWSPDGRHIAFVSYRDGNKEIYLYPLDQAREEAVVNLTNTPDLDEDNPAWSPDGTQLAFTIGRDSDATIYINTFDWDSLDAGFGGYDEARTQLFGQGSTPAWGPDGQTLVYTYERGGASHLIVASISGWGIARPAFSGQDRIGPPTWTAHPLSPETIALARSIVPEASPPLYLEKVRPLPSDGPPYTLVGLPDVNGGDDREFLSDRVDDSFNALRRRVLEETGIDYLGVLGDSIRRLGAPPLPGQSPYDWHKAGRAFSFSQGFYDQEPPLVEVVREEIGYRTYWRVYLRTARQDGSMGRPLREAPWDLKARFEGGLAEREGGRLKVPIPTGYYVDFTTLAADYGWERVPAIFRWRYYWEDIRWWEFRKTQGLTWWEAMLELYRPEEVQAVFGESP